MGACFRSIRHTLFKFVTINNQFIFEVRSLWFSDCFMTILSLVLPAFQPMKKNLENGSFSAHVNHFLFDWKRSVQLVTVAACYLVVVVAFFEKKPALWSGRSSECSPVAAAVKSPQGPTHDPVKWLRMWHDVCQFVDRHPTVQYVALRVDGGALEPQTFICRIAKGAMEVR